jgi:hypothetical protein
MKARVGNREVEIKDNRGGASMSLFYLPGAMVFMPPWGPMYTLPTGMLDRSLVGNQLLHIRHVERGATCGVSLSLCREKKSWRCSRLSKSGRREAFWNIPTNQRCGMPLDCRQSAGNVTLGVDIQFAFPNGGWGIGRRKPVCSISLELSLTNCLLYPCDWESQSLLSRAGSVLDIGRTSRSGNVN